MVGNIVDVGWATIKSGCLPITVQKFPRLQSLCQGKGEEGYSCNLCINYIWFVWVLCCKVRVLAQMEQRRYKDSFGVLAAIQSWVRHPGPQYTSQSNELHYLEGPRVISALSFIGGVHIVAKALLDPKKIWFS